MNKKIFSIISIVFMFLGLFCFICFCNRTNNYGKARRDSIQFLNANIKDLKVILDKDSIGNVKECSKYKKIEYCFSNSNYNGKEYVDFEVNSQGFLGGQYWGIIYSKNDDIIGHNKIEIYDQYMDEGTGNNILITEKIKKNWYFYFIDYDGKIEYKIKLLINMDTSKIL